MKPVVVRPASFPRHIRRFAKTWRKIYADEPAWVEPLRLDLYSFLNPWLNPYFSIAKVQPFIAWRGRRAVGTIVATWDPHLQETEPGVGLFGFFEFPDDPEVARPLFDAACDWLRVQGATRVRGPFNLTTNHEFGLLLGPYDDPPCVANPYTGPWQPAIYDALGLQKVRDWYGYWIPDGEPPTTIVKVGEWLGRRHQIELRPLDPDRFSESAELFWQLYNDAWQANWGHVHMERREFMYKARSLKAVLEPSLAMFAYVDGKPAAAAITLPDYNQVAIHMRGKLLPFGWLHLLRAKHHITRVRTLVLGVHPDFQQLPLGVPLYLETWRAAQALGMRGCEVSLVLEDNTRMRQVLERLGGEITRTYRTYEMQL